VLSNFRAICEVFLCQQHPIICGLLMVLGSAAFSCFAASACTFCVLRMRLLRAVVGGPSVLRALILSDNTGLIGSVQAISGPPSLQTLYISNTSINGSFGAGWMTQQSPQLTCLVAYNTPGLCGQLYASLPCSLTHYVQGTGLSE
jgi:hypothetical protein